MKTAKGGNTPEERLAKLEKWAVTTGKALNRIQRENIALKAKIETLENTAGRAAFMTENQKRDHQADKMMNDIFGAHECRTCKKRINLKKDLGHWCDDGAWIKHSDMKVK